MIINYTAAHNPCQWREPGTMQGLVAVAMLWYSDHINIEWLVYSLDTYTFMLCSNVHGHVAVSSALPDRQTGNR